MKQPDNHLFELIGERLRSDWREIETAPLLPARITMLLAQLKQREAPAPAHRRAVNVGNAVTRLGGGEGLGTNAAPMTDRGSRRLVLAEA